MSKTINLFVSHSGRDESKIDSFKKLMEKKGYDFRDSSIRESEPNRANNEDYIKQGILKPAIDWAGTVVVLVGKDTHNRDWVNWEIEYAVKKGKKIIGVYLPGETGDILPTELKKYGYSCVGWNSDKIDAAIKNDDAIWEDENGNAISPNTPNRGTC